MALPSIFDSKVIEGFFIRLEKIKFDTQPQWGKMTASKMLAHLNVAYELAYEKKTFNSNFFMKFILKTIIKKIVTNEKSYKQNSPTAPVFIIESEKDFAQEKANLIVYIKETQSKGTDFFEGKVNQSFGKLTAIEWNNMFYKHLDHHFRQFGA